jgi:PEP-CTERM motif
LPLLILTPRAAFSASPEPSTLGLIGLGLLGLLAMRRRPRKTNRFAISTPQ